MIRRFRVRPIVLATLAVFCVIQPSRGDVGVPPHSGPRTESSRRVEPAPGNLPPAVQITCPQPSALGAVSCPPAQRIFWKGFDPDGGPLHQPIGYRYILLGPSSEFPVQLALSNPDSLRRYYVNHPLGPWHGWESTGPETTSAPFTNLIPNVEYVFAVIAFDEAGDYSPVFSLSSNMLHLAVSFDAARLPVLTLIGPGLRYQYPSGGYCPCASAEVPVDVPERRPATFQWFAESFGICDTVGMRAYRWALDIDDVFDQTPRTDEQTDLRHWSAPSPAATSATLGPFVLAHPPDPEIHFLYIEAEDGIGLKSLGIIRIVVVPAANRAPDCRMAAADPPEIWPPKHALVPVRIVGVTDPDGDPITLTVTAVTQDEPVAGREFEDDATNLDPADDAGRDAPVAGDPEHRDVTNGKDGHRDGKARCPDAVIDANGGVSLRAERSPAGDGRVYSIWFTASDGQGGTCDGSVRVCVPHDRRHRACNDDGPRFNSLGPCPRDGRGTMADAPTAVTLTTPRLAGDGAIIEYSLPEPSDVLIAVYDVVGRRVATIESAQQSAGVHAVTWNPSNLANGMYYCRLRAGTLSLTKSLLIVR